MSSERWSSIEELSERALELPEDERQRFLEVECEGDPELLAEAVGLLTARHVDDFLESPCPDS